MDGALFKTLIQKSESDTLDFKSQQYSFIGGSDDQKSHLLKDILAFANAWKDVDAYILIGVKEKDRRADGVCGIVTHLADNDLQEFVNKKTNRPVAFSVKTISASGTDLDVIQISKSQPRPIFLKNAFGRLAGGLVYIRRGSATFVADADEIAEMGKISVSANLMSSATLDMVAFARPEDSQKTGYTGRVYLQLTNAGTKSARNIIAMIKHDEAGCRTDEPHEDWEHRDTRLNPWALRYRHSLNPRQAI